MDRPVALAAAETDGQTSPNVTGSSRWHLELLSDEGTDGCGGSVQREHQNSVTPRPRLSRHELSAAEGTALGSHQDRIRRFPESRVECAFVQIVVQNRLFKLPEGAAMSSSSIRKHAGTSGASDQPPVPEPSFAERARTLVYVSRIGSLSTLSRKQPGFPFGSVMPYGLDDRGRPIFLISTMAMHTQNLQADPRASLLVTQGDAGGDPLGASRVTLVGNALPLAKSEVPAARQLYLQRYDNSKYWVDFEDFSFYH